MRRGKCGAELFDIVPLHIVYECNTSHGVLCSGMLVIESLHTTLDISGTCTGIVVSTGDHTVMGRIARLTGSIVEESETRKPYIFLLICMSHCMNSSREFNIVVTIIVWTNTCILCFLASVCIKCTWVVHFRERRAFNPVSRHSSGNKCPPS